MSSFATFPQPVSKPKLDPFFEIGNSGLRRFGGIVQEEFLTSLRGRQGVRVYQEMRDNDATIGGILTAIEQTIRKVNWFVDPTGNTNEELANAEFLRENTEDMSHTWDSMMCEISSMFPFGWAWLETTYKLRKGDKRNPKLRSKFTDGSVGWRKIRLRMQSSLHSWVFDAESDVQAMVQQTVTSSEIAIIPIQKSLLFRIKSEGNNPEGRSLLRNIYRSWFIKKNIEELEAIGVERDLIGLPWIKPPEGFDINSKESAVTVGHIKNLLYSLRRDEQDGIFLPPNWEIELLGAGGTTRRQFDLDKIVTRYDKRIAVSTLAQAIMLGMDRVGSFALSKSQVDDFFLIAVQGYLNTIAETFNRFAVPALFKLNPQLNTVAGRYPQLIPGRVSGPRLSEIGDYIQKLSGAGYMFEGEDIERELLRIGEFDEAHRRKTKLTSSQTSSSVVFTRPEPKQQQLPGTGGKPIGGNK